MKYLLTLLFVVVTNTAYAGSCGTGKITHVLQGGWDTDDFMIKIDYSEDVGQHVGTEHSGFIGKTARPDLYGGSM